MTKYVQDFKLEKTIGCGTFGKVKRAKHVPTGELAAIKILQKDKIITKKDMQRVQREMDILKKVNHPNILQLYQLEQSTKNYYIVTELVEGQELFQKINRLGKLSEELAATYFLQILDTLLYLQSNGICHRDIKPENVIVKDDCLKLIDFGLSNYCKEGDVLYTSCGSPCYAAPEMMNEKQYDPEKTQVWALGVTLYAMLTGKLPFQHSNTTKLYKLMATNQYEEVRDISSSLKSLIRAMIEVDPSLRIGLKQIKQHVWVRFQKHQFYQPKNSIEWNDKILEEMCESKKKSAAQLKKQVSQGYGKQSSYYHMLLKKELSCKKQQEYTFHDGPVHLNFIFPTLPAVKAQIEKTMPTARWTSSATAQTSTETIAIKKIFGSTMYYLAIKPVK